MFDENYRLQTTSIPFESFFHPKPLLIITKRINRESVGYRIQLISAINNKLLVVCTSIGYTLNPYIKLHDYIEGSQLH